MKSASQCNKNKACSYTSKMEAAFTLETELPGLTEGEREHLHFSDCHLKLRWGADGENVKPERVPAFPSWCSSLCALVFHCFNSYHLCSCFVDVQRAPSYNHTNPTGAHPAPGDLFSAHITVLHPSCSSIIAISLCSV